MCLPLTGPLGAIEPRPLVPAPAGPGRPRGAGVSDARLARGGRDAWARRALRAAERSDRGALRPLFSPVLLWLHKHLPCGGGKSDRAPSARRPSHFASQGHRGLHSSGRFIRGPKVRVRGEEGAVPSSRRNQHILNADRSRLLRAEQFPAHRVRGLRSPRPRKTPPGLKCCEQPHVQARPGIVTCGHVA